MNGFSPIRGKKKNIIIDMCNLHAFSRYYIRLTDSKSRVRLQK